MFAEFQRQMLLNLSHRLIVLGKKLQGAADKAVPHKRLFLQDCEDAEWQNVRPCFVLSTGRTGTLLLNSILQLSPDAMPVHEPQPELYRPSRKAYEEINSKPEVYREVFKSAREEYLLKSVRQEKVYIETNNQITFFAPVIRSVFPNAVFIHLVRHPADFVRSGVRRKWYTGKHSHDIGRIFPLKDPYKSLWPKMTAIEKVGWLWNETNTFIEDFLSTLASENYIRIRSEDLFNNAETSWEIFDFLMISGSKKSKVEKVMSHPHNVQKKGDFPHYANWKNDQQQSFIKMVPLASTYNYDI